jgi:hypothetical protein
MDGGEVAAKIRQRRAHTVPTHARYELYGVKVEPIVKKTEEKGASKYSGHSELDLRRGRVMAAAADYAMCPHLRPNDSTKG